MNHVVYVREKESQTGEVRHTFIVKRYGQSQTVAFYTYFVILKNPSVVISDMRLFEDTCYFCGKLDYTPTGSGPGTRGFVGRFLPKEIVGDSGAVEYYIVDTTIQLTRLAISKENGYPLLISAIGEAYPSGRACIVELKNRGSSGWGIVLDTINNDEMLVFSDIMTIRDSLRLLVQYDCVNDNPPCSSDYDYSHQIFLLDKFKHGGCHATYYSLGTLCYMARYYLDMDGYNFHHDRAPMRLFHINDLNKEFGVAFGVEEEEGLHGGIRLFKFHHEWEYNSSLYYRTGIHTEIKDVGNQYKSDTLYVLSKSSSNPKGMITLPSMGIGPTPVVMLSHFNHTFNSLTQKFTGNHIDISCHDNSYGLHLFDQYIYNFSFPSCFHSVLGPNVLLPGKEASSQYLVWRFTEEKPFEWETAKINKIQIETNTICEECN